MKANADKYMPINERSDDAVPASWVWGLAIAVVAVLLLWSPAYFAHLLVMLGIYLLLTYSLNLVTGFGGLIVFCHAVFYGIGAYAYALSRLLDGASAAQGAELLWVGQFGFFGGLAAAVAAGMALAAGIGWVSLRFRGDHFIFATLGFQMIIFVLLCNWVELTRGPFGIYGVPRPGLFGLVLRQPWQYLCLISVLLGIVLPLLFRLYRSPFGLALNAMREDEKAAQAMGIHTNRLALVALTVSGGIAALAGALYAGYVTYIDPTSFSLRESIFLVTILMLGGGGNIKGPLVGAIVMLALPEVLRFVGMPDAVAANVREIIYGSILAALMYWRPQGLAGTTLIR